MQLTKHCCSGNSSLTLGHVFPSFDKSFGKIKNVLFSVIRGQRQCSASFNFTPVQRPYRRRDTAYTNASHNYLTIMLWRPTPSYAAIKTCETTSDALTKVIILLLLSFILRTLLKNGERRDHNVLKSLSFSYCCKKPAFSKALAIVVSWKNSLKAKTAFISCFS